MALPTMPTGYRWFRGGPGLSRAGRNALFAADDTQVWVWDEETDQPVTDTLVWDGVDGSTATPGTPKLDEGWVLGAGLPEAVRVASFSLGQGGKRYEMIPVRTLIDAAASLAPTDTQVASLIGTDGTDTQVAGDARYTRGIDSPVTIRAGSTTAQINAAMNTARSQGKPVLVMPGAYTITGAVDPSGLNISAFGAVWTVAPGTTQTYNVLHSVTGGCTIAGLTIDLNKANTTDPGTVSQGAGISIAEDTVTGVRLPGVTVKNGWQIGVLVGGQDVNDTTMVDPANAVTIDAKLRDVTVTGCKWGIWVFKAAGVRLENCTTTGNGTDGVYDYLTRDTVVTGGVSNSNGRHGIVTQYSDGFKAAKNTANTNTNIGITVGGGLSTLPAAVRYSIDDNTCKSNGWHGVSIDTTVTAGTVVVADGSVTDNKCVSNGMHGIYLHNAKYLAAKDNICRGAPSTYAGMAVDSANCTIEGNVLTGNDCGLDFVGTSSQYGSHRIGPNVVTGNTTANVRTASTGVSSQASQWSGMGIRGTKVITSTSSPYTVTSDDDVILVAGATAVTVNLPDATLAMPGRTVTVRNINCTGGVTVQGANSRQVDFAATQSLASGTKATYVTDGTPGALGKAWFTV